MDLYNHKKRFEGNIKRVKESGELIEENKILTLNFKDYLLSEGFRYFKN